MVLDNAFPPDIRVEKEIRSLNKANYEVTLLSYRSRKDEKRYLDYAPKTRVVRFNRREDYPLLFSLTQDLRKLTHFSTIWWLELRRLLKKERFDLVHVHDLPLIKTVIHALPHGFSSPIVLDLHENYPAYISSTQPPYKREKVFRKWFAYEHSYLHKVQGIIVVVEENRDYLIKEQKVDPQKIIIVSNTFDQAEVDDLELKVFDCYRDNFVISYVGGFGGFFRGIHTLVEAIPYLRKEIPEVKLLLVGAKSGGYSDYIRRLIRKNDLENIIELIPRVDFATALSYIKTSDICCVPHQKELLTEACAPHKLFQYMYFRKPVLVSDCRSLARMVEGNGCGKVFEAGNPEDCARKLLEFYREDRTVYAESGFKAVQSHYNWEKESQNLLQLYQQLLYPDKVK